MRVERLPQAERNRDDQFDFVAAHNPQAALDLGDRILVAVRRLADHPHRARPGRAGTTGELAVASTPYVVFYRVDAAAVVILRVFLGA